MHLHCDPFESQDHGHILLLMVDYVENQNSMINTLQDKVQEVHLYYDVDLQGHGKLNFSITDYCQNNDSMKAEIENIIPQTSKIKKILPKLPNLDLTMHILCTAGLRYSEIFLHRHTKTLTNTNRSTVHL